MTAFAPSRRNRTLSLMPTYRCTAACAHCGTLSSPQEKTHLEQSHLIAAIDQAAGLDYRLVVFTGGEATLAGDALFELIDHANGLGLETRVVTNAWWARNPDRAAKWIDRFRNSGLTEINFSTGDEHVRFVPVDRVLMAAEAAVAATLPVSIMVEVTQERTITKAVLEDHPRFRRFRAQAHLAQVRVLESPWMPLTPEPEISYENGLAADRYNVSARTGCDSVLSTTTVEADGTIGACCGIGLRLIPELHVGDIRHGTLAEADQAADRDFLKHWIHVEGPERILAWAATHDPSIDWEGRYAHRCQACMRLYKDPTVRSVIEQHYREKVADVMLGEWLMTAYPGPEQSAPGSADGTGIRTRSETSH